MILDNKARAEAGLEPGDDVVVTPAHDGVFITKKGSRAAAVLAAAAAVMDKNAEVFAILKDR